MCVCRGIGDLFEHAPLKQKKINICVNWLSKSMRNLNDYMNGEKKMLYS